jgi:hypothetical protein
VFAVAGNIEGKHWKIVSDILETLSHETLDREDRVLRVLDQPRLGDIADKDFAAFFKVNDGWDELASIPAGQNTRYSIFNNGNETVRGAEVDSNDLGH